MDLRGSSRLTSEKDLVVLAGLVREMFRIGQEELKSAEFCRFQGDEIMAVYKDENTAVRETLNLRKKFSVVSNGGLDMGMGIHKDKGLFLKTKETDFHIIRLGGAFNIAKRLEGLSRGGIMTVSSNVYEGLTGDLKKIFKWKKKVKVKHCDLLVETYVNTY